MSALSFEYKTFLCVIFLGIGADDHMRVSAVAQGTEGSRQLERVEINGA